MSGIMPKPLSTKVTFEMTISMKVCGEKEETLESPLDQFGKLPKEKKNQYWVKITEVKVEL